MDIKICTQCKMPTTIVVKGECHYCHDGYTERAIDDLWDRFRYYLTRSKTDEIEYLRDL